MNEIRDQILKALEDEAARVAAGLISDGLELLRKELTGEMDSDDYFSFLKQVQAAQRGEA